MSKRGFFDDFLKSEYDKQQEEKQNVISNEKQEESKTNLTLIGLFAIFIGIIPFLGVIVNLFINNVLVGNKVKVKELQVADFVGTLLLSYGLILSVGSTIYYIWFKIIFN
jgi:hypothetical protein